MVGLQAQVSRLEIILDPRGLRPGAALLITGVEIIPTQTVQALRLPTETTAAVEPQLLALKSLAEAIIATDEEGHINFMNARGRAAHRQRVPRAVAGKLLEDIVGLVDETDRRLLADPVRQALTSGAPVNLSRRALLVSRANGNERSIELSASPIRNGRRSWSAPWSCCTTSASCAAWRARCPTRRRTMRSPAW